MQKELKMNERELVLRKMPNPTEQDLIDPVFNAIWNVTKTWDVNAPEYYEGYCGLNGSQFGSGESDLDFIINDDKTRTMNRGTNYTYKYDKDAYFKYNERIQCGLILFGKYFRS